jgi:anion-transporting  ArsA/GET3 family ATPase
MSETIDQILRDEHIIVCAGSGGVGKTTTSAALAIRAAEMGRRVVVCTIDPALRLAQAMGLEELDNTPRKVEGIEGDGELWAMMLDTRRTFDDLILELTTQERAQAIFENPFYDQIAGTLSGTHEYMAMAKLWELHEQGRYELIIVDTPPTRSALDFLDGPRRLSDFLEGKLLRMLLLPAFRAGRRGMSLVNLGTRAALKAMTKITGSDLLSDVAEFLKQFDGMYDDFRKRSQQVRGLLGGRHTRFLIISAPTASTLTEARSFVKRLIKERMMVGGVVVNRSHPIPEIALPSTAPGLGEAVNRYSELRRLSEREEDLIARILDGLAQVPTHRVPELDEPVLDLPGLRDLAQMLAGSPD